MCVMTLQFPNKGIATLAVSMNTKLPNELNIQGLKGHIRVSLYTLFIQLDHLLSLQRLNMTGGSNL